MSDEQLDLESTIAPEAEAQAGEDAEAKLEKEREAILTAVGAGRLDTLSVKVAWVLNRVPESRDSDPVLWAEFWQEFDGVGSVLPLSELRNVTSPVSLTRERARLQNEYRLFVASPVVREHRGTLTEEERERALALRPSYPGYTVYIDESGKNDTHLVLGAVWFPGAEAFHLTRTLDAMAEAAGFKGELHFKEIDERWLPFYLEVLNVVMRDAPTLSFTVLSVERKGLKNVDRAIEELFFHLVLRGIEHLDTSGRAPLPRTLSVYKDAENPGPDRILLANVGTRLKDTSAAQLEGRLYVQWLLPAASKDNRPVQLADLFTSSVARERNATGGRDSPRDRFADALLSRLGMPKGPQSTEQVGDMAVHIFL